MLVEPFKDVHGHTWHVELGVHHEPSRLDLRGLQGVVMEGKADVGPDRHADDPQYGPIYRQARELRIPVYLVEQRRFLAEFQAMLSRSAATTMLFGPLLHHSSNAPAILNALALPNRERMRKEDILTPWRVWIGKRAIDPVIGLRNAIHASKGHLVAERHGKAAHMGFVIGRSHWLSLQALENPKHAEDLMRRYGGLLYLETEAGLVHRYQFDGRKWARKDLRL